MKHPKYEILQDYFENALNQVQELLVKDHLLSCDECTKILSQFAQIETKLQNAKSLRVSDKTKEKIYSDAKLVLSKKRDAIKERENQREEFKTYIEEWKNNIFPEIKVPALQLCSLGILLSTFVTFEKMYDQEEEFYKPLSTDVKVFTYKDIAHKTED